MLSMMILFVMSAFTEVNNGFEISVRESVNRQMKEYPESTLRDLYKSFFQDRFGPGHIINDPIAAKNYLLQELDSYSKISGEMIEPTGWQHNFYRVNLRVIKENLISCDILLDALVRSANAVEPITIEEWREEWAKIEAIIRNMDLSIPDYEMDFIEISNKLQEGKYVGHHSEAYNKAYDPHYRIIDEQIFEKELRRLLE